MMDLWSFKGSPFKIQSTSVGRQEVKQKSIGMKT
jgi:hypothetical protein